MYIEIVDVTVIDHIQIVDFLHITIVNQGISIAFTSNVEVGVGVRVLRFILFRIKETVYCVRFLPEHFLNLC